MTASNAAIITALIYQSDTIQMEVAGYNKKTKPGDPRHLPLRWPELWGWFTVPCH
jgi:hypothetical protein